MRWPETAIARRDDLLARTRRLTLLVAGTASAASIGLATVLGLSIPGKAATTTGTQAPTVPTRAPRPRPASPGSTAGPASTVPARPRPRPPPPGPADPGSVDPVPRRRRPRRPLVGWLVTTAHVLWYLTRATGLVALILLTATIVLGIIGTARAASPRWPRLVTAGLHRNLALTATALVAVHVVTTITDPFVSISLVAAFVPFASSYRPIWLSLGALAFDLMLAVLITSLVRDRLSHRAWRAVHLLVYVCWPVALWHGLGTGTDTKLVWVLALNLICSCRSSLPSGGGCR